MSGRKLLLDSNIVIYVAKKELAPEVFLLPEDMLLISDITLMETLGYPFNDPYEKQETENLLSILIRIPIDDSIVQKVIEIRQTNRIKLPDAIIAATAIVYNCTISTRNISDFSRLSGLVVVNPFDK
jgi:predicted nucleic acid-binding protein